jgi:uncharacterized membrane protein YbaN (DUF454 family)
MTTDTQVSLLARDANAPGAQLSLGSRARRVLALCLGSVCVVFGVIGAVLPLIPSTPFFLCAAGCFASAYPRLEAWLLSFAFIGGPVRAWRERGAIARPAKLAATIGMSVSLAAYAASGASPWALVAVAGLLALCAAFIWTRPC